MARSQKASGEEANSENEVRRCAMENGRTVTINACTDSTELSKYERRSLWQAQHSLEASLCPDLKSNGSKTVTCLGRSTKRLDLVTVGVGALAVVEA